MHSVIGGEDRSHHPALYVNAYLLENETQGQQPTAKATKTQ
jgi:hypothetical protein